MRPQRLELAGFTAYRDGVCVDFSDADLFALSGPTGSGKTSLLDAMCFALYGSIPRLDRRAVAPVVAVGRPEARIRFDFTVGGQQYTAVRVVRRTATGATTKEARLEAGDEVLAGDAEGVSRAVERVLGLGFDQFTKCVVLPQGEFARFLHDKPGDRQELLVKLLDLKVYERMRSDANLRAKSAEVRADLLEQQLSELADATPEAVAAAEERVTQLQQLGAQLDTMASEIERATRERDRLAAEQIAAERRIALLRNISMPAEAQDVATSAAAAEDAVNVAEQCCQTTASRLEEAERARGALGDPGVLRAVADRHERHAALLERRNKGEPVVSEYREAEAAAQQQVATAEESVRDARTVLEDIRRRHVAATLARDLTVGEVCPVCAQTVTARPHHDLPAAVQDAERRVATAEQAAKDAAATLRERTSQRSKAEQLLEGILADLRELDDALAGQATAEEVARQLQKIDAADKAVTSARSDERAAAAARREAAARAAEAARRRDEAWRTFDAARDAVAAFGPPVVERDDVAKAWMTLEEWAAAEAARQNDESSARRTEVRQLEAQLQELVGDQAARCAVAGVAVPAGVRPADAVSRATMHAVSTRDRLAADVERAERLRLELAGQRRRQTVARTLGQHLAANGFERWLLDEALQRLATGATGILQDLSGGQYSLELDAQHNFAVVDHRNADERRPARTLSGGETFLASLSLALTLAEHLTELAVDATPRLESVFLDEGFGTLDPNSLDVVASAIEELGARGRTVGVVTHVRDLADRMPVRFEVRRGPGGATVERVEVG